jgi:ABC-2 type transport system permease protein
VSWHRILAIFRRVTLEIVRDRPSLALLFVAPLVVSGLITFIIREGDSPTVDAVFVGAGSPAGSLAAGRIGEAIDRAGGTFEVNDEAGARAAVEDGRASIAIVLDSEPAPGEAPSLTLVTRGLDPLAEAAQVGALQREILASISAISAGSVAAPTITHVTVFGVPSSDSIAPFAPAIVGFFAYFFVYLLTGVSFLRERTGGTLERLMATPVARGEIVMGYSLGFGLMATFQMLILLTWVLATARIGAMGPLPAFSIGLGIASAGSPLYAFLIVLLLALGAVSLGILISTFARTELQVIQSIPLVLVPQFLLSGVLFPTSSLPEILQPLVVVMPLHYAVDGLRHVFVAGASLASTAMLFDLLVLGAFAAIFAILAALTIRREVA